MKTSTEITLALAARLNARLADLTTGERFLAFMLIIDGYCYECGRKVPAGRYCYCTERKSTIHDH